MYDDSVLIDETLRGRSASFGQLVRKYQDRLYNAMVYVVGSREDARDVVQDAFLKAFATLDQLQRTRAFYAWLYRIAFNVAIRQRRRARRSVSIDQAREATGREPIDTVAGPVEQLEQDERCQQVYRAIAGLNEEHRVVLVLRGIDGCCYRTIAETLDLPIGTVRSRLHRARLQVLKELNGALVADD